VYLLNRDFVVILAGYARRARKTIMYIQICAVNLFEKHHLQD
jgi:hypothetical protein